MSSSRQHPPALSRRERQIMDVVYRLGRAAAADIHRSLPDRPTYTTVRGLLSVSPAGLEPTDALETWVRVLSDAIEKAMTSFDP